jgi:predicted ATP-grasp superfamily ATP-dependent carboligase
MDALILRASVNSLSAARSLGRAGLRVAIAATGEDRATLKSRYVSRFFQLAEIDDSAIDRLMEIPTSAASRPFLLATGDQDALLVAKHQERLARKFCFILPGHSTLEGIVDKARLYEAASRFEIPHPRFCVVRVAADIEEAVRKVGAPCYVKPAMAHEFRRHRQGKLESAADEAELRRILLGFLAMRLVAIPIEIIPGSDGDVHSVCAYIDGAGRPVAWRTKRKIRQFPLDAGDGCSQEITNEAGVAELGLRLLSRVGHRGPATVEFRRDIRDGRYVLMEINARTILGQEMITRSGSTRRSWRTATRRACRCRRRGRRGKSGGSSSDRIFVHFARCAGGERSRRSHGCGPSPPATVLPTLPGTTRLLSCSASRRG